MFTSFLRSEVTQNTSNNFSTLSSWYFHIFCNGKPRRLFIYSRVLKHDKLEETFQILGICHTIEWTSFDSIGIYKCRMIKKSCGIKILTDCNKSKKWLIEVEFLCLVILQNKHNDIKYMSFSCMFSIERM